MAGRQPLLARHQPVLRCYNINSFNHLKYKRLIILNFPDRLALYGYEC